MKKVRGGAQGFTIVETLIFLAVSAALLISAMTMIAGKHRKTEFTQAINEIESRLKDQFNDIATGFYSSSNDFRCTRTGAGGIQLTTISIEQQGKNAGCIFIGKVFQISPNSPNGSIIRVHTVAGRRLGNDNKTEVISIQDARPRLLSMGDTPVSNYPDKPEDMNFTSAISFSNTNTTSFGFGVFTTFRPAAVTTDPDNLAADFLVFSGISSGVAQKVFVDTATARLTNGSFDRNPSDGISICINSEGTNESAKLIVGAQTSGVSTRIDRFTDKKDCQL